MRAPHLAARFDLLDTGALNLREVILWIMSVLMLCVSTVIRTLITAVLR
jgi:hypothetical protein